MPNRVLGLNPEEYRPSSTLGFRPAARQITSHAHQKRAANGTSLPYM